MRAKDLRDRLDCYDCPVYVITDGVRWPAKLAYKDGAYYIVADRK